MREPFKLNPPPIRDEHFAATQRDDAVCVYCESTGRAVDTEGVSWPCPQRCEAGAEQPQRFIVSEVMREVGIVRLVTLNAEDVREIQPGDEVTLTRGVGVLPGQQQEVRDEVIGYVHKDWTPENGRGRIFGHCPDPDYVAVTRAVGVLPGQQQEGGRG